MPHNNSGPSLTGGQTGAHIDDQGAAFDVSSVTLDSAPHQCDFCNGPDPLWSSYPASPIDCVVPGTERVAIYCGPWNACAKCSAHIERDRWFRLRRRLQRRYRSPHGPLTPDQFVTHTRDLLRLWAGFRMARTGPATPYVTAGAATSHGGDQ